MDSSKHRLAIVNKDKCKPKRCKQECKRKCPVNRNQKFCIQVSPTSPMVEISEVLCEGCGICVKQCPFKAIQIINVPKNLDKECTHRFGKNSFKLHRLPVPRAGKVLGLVGVNGIGKSTALKILGNKLVPNLGNYENPPEWKQIVQHFKGSELQSYFIKTLQQKLKSVTKPQYVDKIGEKLKGTVGQIIAKRDQNGKNQQLKHFLSLDKLYNHDISILSGGELQRFAIMLVLTQNADILIFDEPSSYLDVKQRIKMAKIIRSMQTPNNYIIVVEHDLAILDYLSDHICCLYGEPAVYGVITMPLTVKHGINVFLAGYIPMENMKFRKQAFTFEISPYLMEIDEEKVGWFEYPPMMKKQGNFILEIEGGRFRTSQITVLLGENGTGKTTFIKMLVAAGKKNKSKVNEEQNEYNLPEMNISYKPQVITPKFEGTVRDLFHSKLKEAWLTPSFISEVNKPLKIDSILDNQVQQLSGGELQRVALVLALGKGAQVYLIDEPSAYLDSEQRVICSRVIKRYILNNHKIAFIVEHDFIMSTYLADQVIVYQGEPGVKCKANTPQGLIDGMNKFLGMLQITFRRDQENLRPRINKLNSNLDTKQKTCGNYFCLEE